jgi:transcriptional regulator with XRE-family HTH domain
MSVSTKPFGYYLKVKRQQLGLSQAALSDKTKIQRTSISRLESIAGNPQWSMIRKIAEEGMGISVAELFQVEPVEAKIPAVLVEGKGLSDFKNSELLIKTSGWPVPILKSDTPLRSKVIEEKHIAGYFVIDQLLIPEVKDHRLVIWPIQNSHTRIRFCLVDIEDTNIVDSQTYLVDIEGIQIRKAWLSQGGALIFDSIFEEVSKPLAFWGRAKDSATILGRIVLLGMGFDKSQA